MKSLLGWNTSVAAAMLLSVVTLSFPAISFGQQSAFVDPSELVRVKEGKKKFLCANLNARWVAGKLSRDVSGLFVSFSGLIAEKKSRLRGASSAKKKKALAKLKSDASLGKRACRKAGSRSGGGSNGAPTPQPTQPPVPSFGNFDFSGNVTAKGAIVFKIPAGLVANVSTGRTLFMQTCVGCHTEKLSRTFDFYRTATMQDPMNFSSSNLPDSELAHITAYLNRYRQQ